MNGQGFEYVWEDLQDLTPACFRLLIFNPETNFYGLMAPVEIKIMTVNTYNHLQEQAEEPRYTSYRLKDASECLGRWKLYKKNFDYIK